MISTLETIQQLIQIGEVRISDHGYNELAEDGILAREAIEGISRAIIIEDYPDYSRGPCVMVLQKDREQKPIHIVWGIPKGHTSPAVLVTGYRPDPELWDESFLRRR